jgi:hypothetical protein
VISIWKRDTVSVDTLNSHLLFIVRKQPLHRSGLLSREVRQHEEGNDSSHKASGALEDE